MRVQVLGTGIDLVENARMHEVLARWGNRFKDRVFLKSEQSYCDAKAAPSQHYAGRFAVKEAVTKAFGTGVGTAIGWLDIEVVRDADTGKPEVRLSARASSLAAAPAAAKVLVSLAHTHRYAVAHALLLAEFEDARPAGRCVAAT